MAAILRVRDNDGNIIEIPAIKGDKGDKGDNGDCSVIVGSYVGDGSLSSRYIDLGVPNVVAAVVSAQNMTDGHPNTALAIIGAGAKYNGVGTFSVLNGAMGWSNTALGLYYDGAAGRAYFNEDGVTYRYIAFTGGE